MGYGNWADPGNKDRFRAERYMRVRNRDRGTVENVVKKINYVEAIVVITAKCVF